MTVNKSIKITTAIMETAMAIFCVIGVTMFLAYLFFIYKTSYDDQKEKKKQEKLNEELEKGIHKNGSK